MFPILFGEEAQALSGQRGSDGQQGYQGRSNKGHDNTIPKPFQVLNLEVRRSRPVAKQEECIRRDHCCNVVFDGVPQVVKVF